MIIDTLNSPAFDLFGAPTTWAEVFGFLTGGLAVYYAARNKLATWPWSILNAIFFFILFLDAKLYADAWLQVFYLVLSIGGVIWWKLGGYFMGAMKWAYRERTEAPVQRTPWPVLAGVAIFIAVFTLFFIPHLKSVHDPYPTLDALTTGLSIGAQFLLSYRRIENWALWITADLFYIPLYQAKGLTLTAIIYVVFLALCFLGVRDWLRDYREDRLVPQEA